MANRREKVTLTLEDQFTTGMAKAAATTALLNRELHGLDGTSVKTQRNLDGTSTSVDRVSTSARRGGSDINQLTGRLSLLAKTAAVLGPGLIPVGALAAPALAGVAAQAGFAAVAGGTLLAAFQGVGTALDAVNKASLEPTEANLKNAKLAMQQISPEARELVRELRDLGPALKAIRDEGAAEMFPGVIEGLEELERLAPVVERIVGAVAGELGDIAADAGASLAGERWRDFFTFLETDAPPAIRNLSKIIGNVTHAAGEMWMALDPLNDDFSQWLVDSTADLDKWAQGLDQTEGFQEFVDYVRENGPQVEQTVGAVAMAFLDIAEAAAPLGGPVLKGVEAIAKAVSAVADSDMGTPIFAAIGMVSALNLALKTTTKLSGLATLAMGGLGGVGGKTALGRGAAGAVAGSVLGGAAKGVVPVFVTNMGQGGLGGPGGAGGKTPPVVGGVPGRGGTRTPALPVPGSLASGLVGLFAAGGAGAGYRAPGQKMPGVLPGFMGGDSVLISNKQAAAQVAQYKELDAQLVKMSKRNPAAAMKQYDAALKESGFSVDQLNKRLPKTAAAFRGQAKATGDVGSLLRQTIPSLSRYDKTLRGFPKRAVTQIAAEGMPKTRAGVVDLTRKYNLTPKQVRTLIREQGGTPTKAKVDSIIRSARTLGGQRPSPRISARDGATPIIRRVGSELRAIDGDVATVRINTLRTTTFSVGGKQAIADGGTVQGLREPYGDKVLTYLAPGEEVITNRNGQADRFRADRAAGRIPAYANGGTVGFDIPGYADGGKVVTAGNLSIIFPAPSVVAASVSAAEKIRVAAAKTARSYREQQDADLEILRGRQRISELEKSLAERGSKRVTGKDGKDDDKRKKGLQDKYKYVGFQKLTGLERQIATAELAQTKREVADLVGLQAQVDALTEARNSSRDTLTGTGDIFGRGTGVASSVASINRTIADITNYGSMFGRLVGAKASPLLLGQIRAKAESGDFRSAIRLGESLLAQPALLGQLNTSLGTLSAVSTNVATLTTDPRVTSGAAFPGASSTVVKTVNVAVDVGQVATLKADLTREITHNVVAALNGS